VTEPVYVSLFLLFPVVAHALSIIEKVVNELRMGKALPALAALFLRLVGRI